MIKRRKYSPKEEWLNSDRIALLEKQFKIVVGLMGSIFLLLLIVVNDLMFGVKTLQQETGGIFSLETEYRILGIALTVGILAIMFSTIKLIEEANLLFKKYEK